MKRKRLLWQIYPAMLLVLLVSLVAVTWYGSTATKHFYLNSKYEDLTARLGLVEGEIGLLLRGNRIEALNAFCRRNGKMAQTRITVIARDGEVLADSDEDPERMENHADRPEVVQVLKGGIGRATRFSHTLGRNLIYVAEPIFEEKDNGKSAVAGILRMSLPLTDIEQAIGLIYHRVILACLLISLLAAVVTLTISRRITRPLERIRKAAESFSQGDFSGKIMMSDREPLSLEMSDLVLTMNQMAMELDDRIGTVSRQHNELQAVFTSMVEAVVAVDPDERILSLNPAAQLLLGMAYPNSRGKKLLEAIRNPKLSRFVKTILQDLEEKVVESEIVVRDEDGNERILHGRGTVLRSGSGSGNGALMVFDDVTKLRKLENMRRDFVANVSHELKTPVTTVKGFIETLLDGEVDNPEQTREFLRISLRNIDRLNAIIDDLLMLSRLEQEEEGGELELHRVALIKPLQTAVDICTPRAAEKKITLSLHCPEDLLARINAPLVEQAVVNLIINAIKYSDPEKEVEIFAVGEENEAVVRVQDHGIGIAREHLPRLFERFYRSDKARSRKLGGTGLGLAIVKHIIQAHGGSVTVASRPGKGTTFTFRLPC